MDGTAYLKIDRRRNKIVATSVRSTRPTEIARTGVWVKLHLTIPESVFQPYEAYLEIPEHDLRGVIVVTPKVEEIEEGEENVPLA